MCSVKNCFDKPVSYGLCDKHRKRKKRNGSEYIHINQTWGDARTVRNDGYIYVTRAGKQVMEHRWLMEQKLGRLLLPNEIVHHKNENKQDNKDSNLELMELGEHTSFHNTGSKRPKVYVLKETIKKED